MGEANKLRYDIWMSLLRQRGWVGGPAAPFTPRRSSSSQRRDEFVELEKRFFELGSAYCRVSYRAMLLCKAESVSVMYGPTGVPPGEFWSKALMQNLAAMGLQRQLLECLIPKEHSFHSCFR